MGSINCRITQKLILEIIAITKAEFTKQTLIHTYVQLVAIAKFRGNGLLDDITTYIAYMTYYDNIIVMSYLPAAVVIDTTVLVSLCLPSLV